MTSSDLEATFESRGVRRGGVLMFAPPVALEFVAAARLYSIPILGIDGLWLRGRETQPSMAHSVDYSADPTMRSRSWDMVEVFIRERIEPEMYVEVVLE